MKTNDRELKTAYREHVQNTPGTREKDCPTSEDIWRFFSEKTSEKRKARLVDHITTCSFCFREFEAFLEISRAEKNLVREVQSRFRSDARKAPLPMVWRYAGAFLMAMAILAAALLSTKWLGFPKRPEERGRLSGQIRLLAPGQETALRSPLVFRWEAVALSEYYIVEVFDEYAPACLEKRSTHDHELRDPETNQRANGQREDLLLDAYGLLPGRDENGVLFGGVQAYRPTGPLTEGER